MFKIVVSIALILPLFLQAQYGVDRIRGFSLKQNDADNHHQSIQPAIRFYKPTNKGEFENLFSSTDSTRKFSILPVVDSYCMFGKSFDYRASAGVNFEKTWGKWYNRTQITGGWSMREDHTQNHAAFLPFNTHQGYIFTDFKTRLAYTPNDQLHIALGVDNQFFGEGYRSLIQGDQVAPAPFVLLRTNFWKLEYGFMYQFFHENNFSAKQLHWKFNTTHYLSWNATKNFNIMLLESIIFQGKDSTYKRGFEVDYLNPFVFFRPQEYSLGSTDNTMLALQTSYYYLDKKHAVYMQLPLDEFVLKAMLKRTKWWANKYGYQLGFKGSFGKWNYIVEGNLIRPYTFSHLSINQNNGNQSRPLGHFLGSNFLEVLTQIQWRLKSVRLGLFSSFVLKGYDENGINFGGDIYQNYLTHPKEYGNTIGQGLTQRSLNLQVQVSTVLAPIQMEIYFQGGGLYSFGEIGDSFKPILMLGIRSNLFQDRKMW